MAIRPTSRIHLWRQFFTGLLFFALVAWIGSFAIDQPFTFVYPAVVGLALLCGFLALTWLTLWAQRKDSRLGQFGIGSLLFLTLFGAIFFAVVRWIVDTVRLRSQLQDEADVFLVVAIICLLVAIVSAPVVLVMTESVLWAAVWVVRQIGRWRRGGR